MKNSSHRGPPCLCVCVCVLSEDEVKQGCQGSVKGKGLEPLFHIEENNLRVNLCC